MLPGSRARTSAAALPLVALLLRLLTPLPRTDHRAYRWGLEEEGSQALLELADELPGAVPLEAEVGDAMVFNIRTYHSAWGDGHTHRRGLCESPPESHLHSTLRICPLFPNSNLLVMTPKA